MRPYGVKNTQMYAFSQLKEMQRSYRCHITKEVYESKYSVKGRLHPKFFTPI